MQGWWQVVKARKAREDTPLRPFHFLGQVTISIGAGNLPYQHAPSKMSKMVKRRVPFATSYLLLTLEHQRVTCRLVTLNNCSRIRKLYEARDYVMLR
jgi:hypothetical protein